MYIHNALQTKIILHAFCIDNIMLFYEINEY